MQASITEYRHDIKIEYSRREHNPQEDLINQDAVNGNNLTNGDSLDAEKRPFIDHYSDVSSPAPKGNITVYVGDDSDKIAVAYEHLVYENRYDKCQFVKDINEFKADRWTKNKSEWDTASQRLQCVDPNSYHCLRTEDGGETEQCLGKVWIQESM
uniref:Uncharacterized protein n=1 Tax=Magallana gigas TaxID=29159 RepID=K1QIE6_MAGGI